MNQVEEARALLDELPVQAYLRSGNDLESVNAASAGTMSVAERRQREREQRRDRILDAAEHVFLERGFDAVTMDDVAAEAEVGKGTLYLYFKHKDDLLLGLVLRRSGPLLQRFGEAAADARDGFDLLERLLRANFYHWSRLPEPYLRLWFSRMVHVWDLDHGAPNSQAHVQHVRRVFSTFHVAIERGQADGSIRADLDPVNLALQLWGGTLGALLVQINHQRVGEKVGRPIDLAAFSDSFMHLLLDGVRRPPPDPAPAGPPPAEDP